MLDVPGVGGHQSDERHCWFDWIGWLIVGLYMFELSWDLFLVYDWLAK